MLEEPHSTPSKKTLTSLSRLQWWAFSVPIFMKTLGIVLLVSAIFGGLVYYQVGKNIQRAHNQMHIQAASRGAEALASRLEGLDFAKDTSLIQQEVDKIVKIFPDVSYVLVFDANDELLEHHFNFPITTMAPYVPEENNGLCATCHNSPDAQDISATRLESSEFDSVAGEIRRFSRPSGIVLEATANIADGTKGKVRVGHGDASIGREMESITIVLVQSLIICVVLGQGLAIALAYLLVHPILNLVQATQAIGDGDFSSRATVYSGDEIGRLAQVFNLMATKLQSYREEVEDKEALHRSLIDRITHAQEEERANVARELHDQLGQSLYRALLSYGALRRDYGTEDSRWEGMEEEMRGLIDDVRRLAWDIRPSILDDFGLNSALKQHVKEISKHTNLPIQYECSLPPGAKRLPDHLEVILYRVAQEAITNIVSHANAKRASVILLRYDSEITLLVEDDGQGFDVDNVFKGDGSSLGLMGMKERVGMAGGVLNIDSQPGKGTVVRVRIPSKEVA